jgi:hypothetical protein
MCVSGYGSFFCLWAVRARSNRRRALIGLWVTPPTTGSIEIERGGDENITINHGCGGRDCGRRRSWPLRPPLGRPRPFQSTERVDRVMGDAVNDRLHRNRAGGVTKNRQGRRHERRSDRGRGRGEGDHGGQMSGIRRGSCRGGGGDARGGGGGGSSNESMPLEGLAAPSPWTMVMVYLLVFVFFVWFLTRDSSVGLIVPTF